MEILENKVQWSTNFQDGWLAHLNQTGSKDWSIYQHPRNSQTPGASGVILSQSKLMFITSAGAFLKNSQQPFDGPNEIGDYSLRTFPSSTPFNLLGLVHEHYDHEMVDQDPQIALPLQHLQEFVLEGRLGELDSTVVSFMGYQPDSARVVDELIPEILPVVDAEKPDAVLLAPV
jgi:hypothetical protein